MQGLAENTKMVFESVSRINCIKEYTLIIDTAIALQINKGQVRIYIFVNGLKIYEPMSQWVTGHRSKEN